jgi:hypothetical protein
MQEKLQLRQNNSFNQEINHKSLLNQNSKSGNDSMNIFEPLEFNCSQCKIKDKIIIYITKKIEKLVILISKIEYYMKNSICSANVISNLTEDLLTLAKMKNNVFELNIEENVNLLDIVYEAF